VARFAADPLFRGIRIQVQTLQSLLDAEDLAPLQLLAEHDLALDVNGGPETPGVIAAAAPMLPDLRFVLNHIGNVAVTTDPPPADWQAGIAAAGACENVFGKISALVEGATREGRTAPDDLDFYRPYIDVVWNAFGPEKVIYGSNWPVSDIGAGYVTLQRIVLQYAFQQGADATANFCSRNALKAYKYVTDRG
jgi:L-fuconolactonase